MNYLDGIIEDMKYLSNKASIELASRALEKFDNVLIMELSIAVSKIDTAIEVNDWDTVKEIFDEDIAIKTNGGWSWIESSISLDGYNVDGNGIYEVSYDSLNQEDIKNLIDKYHENTTFAIKG